MSTSQVIPEVQPSASTDGELAYALEQERLRNRRADLMYGHTGAFRPLLEHYVEQVARARYSPRTFARLRGSITRFFRYVVMNEQIEDLEEIRPSTVTRFIDAERARGVHHILFIGELSVFFEWLISEGRYDRGNPVVSSMHRRQMKAPSASSI
jgi:site-specific recombinase XerD